MGPAGGGAMRAKNHGKILSEKGVEAIETRGGGKIELLNTLAGV
jgi:hypothetical protein